MAASPKALLEWCRVTCGSYPGVEVKNMSASFRDGLAFCAIIHKHRPDLIDFSSLSRGNVYQNNKLAFEVAEAKLGIPPLLDPQDMVSTDAPDFLTVITYVSQYYNLFSGGESPGQSPALKGQASVSHHICTPVLKEIYYLDVSRNSYSLTELETSKEDGHAGPRPRALCSLCSKPVHLIQKRLSDGKVYHRGCFRCTVCRCALLPGSYTPGRDQTSFVCSHHATDGKAAGVYSKQQLRPAGHRPGPPIQTGFYSLSGSAICSVPRYAEPRQASEGSALPVLAPRRSLDSSVVPVPAARSRTAQTMSDSPAGVCQSLFRDRQHVNPEPDRQGLPSATSSSTKVKTNHPWMAIVHPGPWTQLPPAPPPVPVPRSKPVSNTQTLWNRPRMPSLNPFEEDEEEEFDEAPKQEATSPTGPSAGPLEDSGIAREEPGGESERNADGGRDGRACVSTEECEGMQPDTAWAATAGGNSAGTVGGEPADGGQNGPSHATEPGSSEAQRSAALPRSLSVPAIPSERSETNAAAAGLRDADWSASNNKSINGMINQNEPDHLQSLKRCSPLTSLKRRRFVKHCKHLTCSTKQLACFCYFGYLKCFPVTVSNIRQKLKSACKENPFSERPEMTRSQTVQNLSSGRGSAPGHGFPLIRRQVRTDRDVSTEDLQRQMTSLDGDLEALEQRGVELERSIRDGRTVSGKEDQMLTEWFGLVQEQHTLLRRNKELVYLTKQQILEDRQADVEYKLRCLLNKPEKDWDQEDRGQEQQLMAELVTIIEQRNQIISSLDQDSIRERDEDMESTRNKSESDKKKDGLKKTKGKLKAPKVFKMLNHKQESSKEPAEKK
uniref:MICAL like 1 n=1 Tax=Poecilia formosa TaxID=48698 RepID=A0A096LRF8_POEFO